MKRHTHPPLLRALALGALLASGAASAQLRELENPGRVSAVQERLYRMNHEIGLGLTVLPLDSFYKGVAGQVGYTWHFNDHFAWQVGRASLNYNIDTGLREQLERDFAVQPTAFEEVEWMAGSDLVWSPLYGKVAVMNSKVLHFGGHLLLGGTVMKMNLGQSYRPAINIGLGARLFSTQWLSFRFDVTDNVVLGRRLMHVPTFQLSTSFNFGATE